MQVLMRQTEVDTEDDEPTPTEGPIQATQPRFTKWQF